MIGNDRVRPVCYGCLGNCNIACITLSVAYWVLITMGLVAHAHHRMYNAVIENYIRSDYPDYKEDLQRAIKGNRIMSMAITRLWLDKTTERINIDYTIITVSFLVISVCLYAGVAAPWSWFSLNH